VGTVVAVAVCGLCEELDGPMHLGGTKTMPRHKTSGCSIRRKRCHMGRRPLPPSRMVSEAPAEVAAVWRSWTQLRIVVYVSCTRMSIVSAEPATQGQLIGQLWGIFSVPDSLLVSCGEDSQCLTVYWSAVGNILSV
jgi:hypothetical protein